MTPDRSHKRGASREVTGDTRQKSQVNRLSPDAGASRNYWFPNRKLLRSTYVDDLTLSRPDAIHQAFWDEFTALVDVGPPEPVFKVLGRNHFIDVESEAPHLPSVAVANHAISFDMVDYAQQTVDLYLFLTGSEAYKNVQTPFCPEGSLPPSGDEVTGELAPAACKLLMQALWLGRLSLPDIINKPIGDLVTFAQSSSLQPSGTARSVCWVYARRCPKSLLTSACCHQNQGQRPSPSEI